MGKSLKSFKVSLGFKNLDYRLGKPLIIQEVKNFFSKNYRVEKIWNGGRHILGILKKENKKFFLKLATSEGIGVVTKNEYNWNDYFNKYSNSKIYLVPKNYEIGKYKNKHPFIVTGFFEGQLLCTLKSRGARSLLKDIPPILKFTSLIQELPVENFSTFNVEKDFRKRFLEKVNNWFIDIPEMIRKEFNLTIILNNIKEGLGDLSRRPRHGDFTPWHIIRLTNLRFGLIDGEHAQGDSVEGYDICYFIQRIFSVLKDPLVANSVYLELLRKGFNKNRLKPVLSARAIGGFLDESLKDNPDYKFAKLFKDWILKN